MENLNDVEFGSDKSTEEAPILVAQRYLNIYRQIHIFNKEKRDQFDDELLALPQNVSDFFKRMPGGRLLVEHIEEVKTERGISFVKSNKEDFTNGSDTGTQATNDTVAAPQTVSGGTLAVDASFAQALAQSMANAFKQIPATTTATAVSAPSSADFGKAFELIAQEIKASRASLLDVLQEMHVMTSSLIASQVSIARTLESFLKKSASIHNESLPENKSAFVQPQQTYEQNEPPAQTSEMHFAKKKDFSQPVSNDIKTHTFSATEQPTDPKPDVNRTAIPVSSAFPNTSDEIQRKKKKKKKNKENRNIETAGGNIINEQNHPGHKRNISFEQQNTPSAPAANSEQLVPALSGIVREAVAKHSETDIINNVIQESGQFTEENVPQPSADIDLSALSTETIPEKSDMAKDVVFDLDNLSDLIDEKKTAGIEQNLTDSISDFSLPEQSATIIEEPAPQSTSENLDDIFSGDGLDFALPEQSAVVEEKSAPKAASESLDNIFDGDGLDFALPEQSVVIEEEPEPQPVSGGLDNIFNGDGLDFALPKQSAAVEEEATPKAASESLDNIFDGDGLDFALPEQSVSIEDEPEPQPASESLDDIFGGDGSDISLHEQSTAIEEESESQSTSESLNDIFAEDSSEFVFPETNTSLPEETVSTESFSDLEDIFSANTVTTVKDEQQTVQTEKTSDAQTTATQPSRYSEELDRIRAALTSDNIDISSLDQPIALDDYSDDESILNREDDLASVLPQAEEATSQPTESETSDSEEWEWEYVDENGNPVAATSDDDEWEWEYVEDDSEEASDNNNK